MVDVVLLLASLGLLGLATYLGVKLSVDPLETKQQRRLHKKVFIGILVFGAVITLTQQWRNSVEQASLRRELSELKGKTEQTNAGVKRIEERTKAPPQVTVTTPPSIVNVSPPAPVSPAITPRARLEVLNQEVLPVVAGKPVQVNIFLKNTEPVEFEMRSYGAVGIIPVPLEINQQRSFEDQLNEVVSRDEKKAQAGHRVAGSTSRAVWFTLTGPVMSEEAVERFKAGTLALFFLGRVVYTDRAGEHRTGYCAFNQGNPTVFFPCTRFNVSD